MTAGDHHPGDDSTEVSTVSGSVAEVPSSSCMITIARRPMLFAMVENDWFPTVVEEFMSVTSKVALEEAGGDAPWNGGGAGLSA